MSERTIFRQGRRRFLRLSAGAGLAATGVCNQVSGMNLRGNAS
ncbi:hypothetical protein [Pararobbsia alpina]|nr:hypothetical protein [Pararobbsia alpina]